MADIDEAIRLMHASKESLRPEVKERERYCREGRDGERGGFHYSKQAPKDIVFGVLREMNVGTNCAPIAWQAAAQRVSHSALEELGRVQSVHGLF